MKTFIDGAEASLFPLQNLPFGIFQTKDGGGPRVGTAIGEYVLDLAELERSGLLKFSSQSWFDHDCLNLFAAQGEKSWALVRKRLQDLLSISNNELQKNTALLKRSLIPSTETQMLLPFKTESFTDFYASEQHASNVGRLFRGKDNPLLPNWKYLPVGYHGRASTLFISGTDVKRPKGQIKHPDKEHPHFAACEKLDFELELGIFIGIGNPRGEPISTKEAKSHIFGLTLLNDWSARDIQAFEYQPLGPFLAKSFATSISPWVVSLQALEPFMRAKAKQEPEVVDYLKHTIMQPEIKLRVELQPKNTSNKTLICETSSTELYWSMEQMLAHHTINNCIMKTGDLLGSGTISGPERHNWGSLLEITFNGSNPISLKEGGERKFLQDGDTVIFTGYCECEDYKIGFGTLEGQVVPAA